MIEFRSGLRIQNASVNVAGSTLPPPYEVDVMLGARFDDSDTGRDGYVTISVPMSCEWALDLNELEARVMEKVSELIAELELPLRRETKPTEGV